MIAFIKSNMLLAVGLVLLVFGFVAFKVFFLPSDAASPALTATVTDVTSTPTSQNLLAVLVNLRSIQLDNTLFSSPAFISLTNFGVDIAQEPAGRDNPFVPYMGISPIATNPTASSTLLRVPSSEGATGTTGSASTTKTTGGGKK
ncbi:MAG: hypothetical protein WCI89_03285 [bacterium]